MSESTYYKVRDFVQSNVCACISDFAPYLFGEEGDRYASDDEWDNMWVKVCPHCGEEVDEDECELPEDDPDYSWPTDVYRCPHCEETFREAEDHYAEICEYWIVTPWLGEKLRNHGEAVLERWGGWVWGRQGTGQAIALDSVMRGIAKEYGIIGEDEEV